MKEIMVSILDNCTSLESDINPFVFLENKESINSSITVSNVNDNNNNSRSITIITTVTNSDISISNIKNGNRFPTSEKYFRWSYIVDG